MTGKSLLSLASQAAHWAPPTSRKAKAQGCQGSEPSVCPVCMTESHPHRDKQPPAARTCVCLVRPFPGLTVRKACHPLLTHHISPLFTERLSQCRALMFRLSLYRSRRWRVLEARLCMISARQNVCPWWRLSNWLLASEHVTMLCCQGGITVGSVTWDLLFIFFCCC